MLGRQHLKPPDLAAKAPTTPLRASPPRVLLCLHFEPVDPLPSNQNPIQNSPGSFVLQPSAQLTLGSTTQYPVVGHMVVQLTLCDAGWLLLPIHVSPSHGYTMAFRLQQGTFDLEGEAKGESVTCSKHLREG